VSKNILVVGASGVFGGLLTQKFAESGYQVLGTATSNESAAKIPAAASVKLLLDLEQNSSIELLANYLKSQGTQLHGVAIASGLVAFGDILPAEVSDRLFAANVTGPIKLLSQLDELIAPGELDSVPSFVCGITGVVAEKPMASLAPYSASKAAFSAYLKAQTRPMAKRRVLVQDARPPHTETGLATRPIFGTAPNFGLGLEPAGVIDRIIRGIASKEEELSAATF
jgi:cyclic-di-GMP-binding biofilm dispersal mediator protein